MFADEDGEADEGQDDAEDGVGESVFGFVGDVGEDHGEGPGRGPGGYGVELCCFWNVNGWGFGSCSVLGTYSRSVRTRMFE